MLTLILGRGTTPGYSVFGSPIANQETAQPVTPTSVALVLVMMSMVPILIELAVQVIGIH